MEPTRALYAAAANPMAMWRPSSTAPPVARTIGGDGGLPSSNNAEEPFRQRPRGPVDGVIRQ